MTKSSMHPFEQILRYGIAGSTVAVLFSGAVIVLVHVLPAAGPIGASMLAFCLIQPVGYLVHRLVSFPDAGTTVHEQNKSRLRFVIVNLGGFVIVTGGMALVTDVFHASYLWGIALNWALIPAMNFVIYLIWVFNVQSWSKRKLV